MVHLALKGCGESVESGGRGIKRTWEDCSWKMGAG